MVEFCPECSNLLRKRLINGNYFLICKCGYKKEIFIDPKKTKEIIQKKIEDLKKSLIIKKNDDQIIVNIKVITTCPKCGFHEAVAWQEQTLSADEPSTSFFRCLKCNKVWREY